MGPELIAAVAIVVVGGIVSGIAGFGFALVCVPPLLLIYEPPTVVTISIVLSLLSGWVILPGRWRDVRVKTVLALLPWAAAGLLVGVLLLERLPPAAIELLAGAAVIAFALAGLRGWTPPGAHSPLATAVSGGASGVLNATTGMAGPPVVMLFAARDFDMHALRTSIVAYFVCIDVVGLALLARREVIGRPHLLVALALLPAALLGTLLGRRLVRRVSVAAFRRLTLALLLATGAVGAVNAVLELARP